MLGSTIGAYTVTRELGSGGMGTVYLGEGDDQQVALKVVHPHLIASPGFFKRFMREAELGRKVTHVNVVRTLDVDLAEAGGQMVHYMVMEYVEGKDLRELLGDLGTIPEALLREIALQTAAGLTAIHAGDIVHRDLKPENILITDDEEIRIMDLGVAKLQEASIAITKEGQFAGSLLYAAPEQFKKDDEVGPLSDLYSLGVLLYEMATGSNPFRSDDAASVIQAHLNEEPPRPHERNDELSPFLSEVIVTLLAKRPVGRFASAAALHQVLTEAEQSEWWAEHEPVETTQLPKIRVSRETELHGRDKSLAQLRECFEQAAAGSGSTVWLEGEAGIGKTRLVDAFVREVGDAHVLYGSYPPSGGMGGFSDAVIGKFGEVRLAEALRPYLKVTPSLVPAFAALVRHEAPPSGTDPLTGDSLQAVAVHLMRALAAEKPLVWIVDDLHFAPEESRGLVLALARAVEDHRVLLVATSRPGVELKDFSRLENFKRIEVGRLSPREVLELLQDAFQSHLLADKLGAKIALKSDGVPFFVFEMIRGLKEGNFITQQADGAYVQTQIVSAIEVPSAVKDLIEARLNGLDDDDRDLLDVAAVQGMEFEPELIAEVLDLKSVRVLRRLAAIERRSGLVRAAGDNVRFDQNQIQEVLYSELLPKLRREYHMLLADAYEGDDPVFLARNHLLGSKPKKALKHLELALEQLEKSYRNEGLVDLATRALAIDGLLAGEERVKVLLRHGSCLNVLGRRTEARVLFDKAVALADAADDGVLRAKARLSLGQLLTNLSENDAAQNTLQDALDMARAAGDQRELEVKATGILGIVLSRRGRLTEALELHEGALALSREGGDRRGEARAIGNFGFALIFLGRYAEAREHYERHLALSRELGDRRGEATATGNLGLVFSSLGHFAKSLEYQERQLALCREIGNRQGEAQTTGNLSNDYARLGRRALAREFRERHRTLCREVGYRRGEGFALLSMAEAAEEDGDIENACRLAEEALTLRRELGEKAPLAHTLVALGRLKKAPDLVDEALTLAREAQDPYDILYAAIERARLPGGDIDAALAAAEAVEGGPGAEQSFRLWQLTGDAAHLEAAKRKLDDLVAHAPEEDRESMIENVKVHREIRDAR